MSKHLIYKQKVTLHLSKRDEAYALQDRVSRLLQNELLDSLQSVLDNAFPPDKIIRIDKLQLDLGSISAQNFEPEFKTQFIAELTKSLASKKESLSTTNDKEGILSKAQSLENTLIFFLEKGYLPWYSSAQNKVDWEAEILNNLTESEYRDFLNWLRDNYLENPVIVERLVLQFSDKFIGELLMKTAPVFDESWEFIFADYLGIFGDLDKSESAASNKAAPPAEGLLNDDTSYFLLSKLVVRDKIWQFAFRVLLNAEAEPVLGILKLLFNYWGVKSKHVYALKEERINEGLKTKTVKQAFKKLIAQLNADGINNTDPETKPLDNNKTVKNKNDAEAEDITHQNIVQNKDIDAGTPASPKDDANNSLKKGPSANKKSSTSEGDIISVNNCGIVILHPFLKAYFEGLDLLNKGSFINDEAAGRAVLLLHYLATGETEVAEFDLTLQKILCGYALEDTLPSAIILTDNERTETDNLLKAVLSHWEPLKNTSIDGFRSTFLQRNGNLELKESGWLLTIEQKTIDILLGKLPWGFSTIRMPWMLDMISVDWY